MASRGERLPNLSSFGFLVQLVLPQHMLVLKVYGKHRPRALDLARLDVEKFGCSSGDNATPAFTARVA